MGRTSPAASDVGKASSSARRWWVFVALFGAALATRLLFLLTSLDRHWPYSLYYEGDAAVWVEYARALNAGRAFESDLPIRSPGVAWLFHFLSPGSDRFNFVSLKVCWCVASSAGCAIAYLCYRREFEFRVSIIAAGMCCFSFASYVLATSLNNEALYTALLMLIVLCTLRWVERGGWCLVTGLGAMHGLATLLRPEHSLLLICFAGYTYWRSRARGGSAARKPGTWKSVGLMVAMSLLICLPWSVRGSLASRRFNETAEQTPDYGSAAIPWTAAARASYLDGLPAFSRYDNFAYLTFIARNEGATEMTRDRLDSLFLQEFDYVPESLRGFTFVSSQGPLSFALANHPEANGGFSKRALDSRFATQVNLHLALPSHLRLYNRGYSVGWHYIADDVGRWLGLTGEKLRRFADGASMGFTGFNLPSGRGGVREPVDMVAPFAGSGLVWRALLGALFVAGVVVAIRARVGGIWLIVIAYKLVVTILFYGYARQAASILPAIFVFLAIGVDAFALRPILRMRLRPIVGRVVSWSFVALLVVVEIVAGSSVPPMSVDGTHERAPQWGRHAIASFERLELRPVSDQRLGTDDLRPVP